MKKLLSLFVFSLLLLANDMQAQQKQSLTDEQVMEYVKTATEAGKS